MRYTKEEIAESNLFIGQIYGFRCIRCGKPNVFTIHEIEPRSARPRDWLAGDNRVPLCAQCHEFAHVLGARNSADELRQCQARALRERGMV